MRKVKGGRPRYTLKGPIAQAVIVLRHANPRMEASEIARLVGRTRERVRQILARAGMETNIHGLNHPPHVCPRCGKHTKTRIKTMCRACYRNTPIWGTLRCEQCGGEFKRRDYQIRASQRRGSRHIWCGKECQGKWLAQHHGVETPGNTAWTALKAATIARTHCRRGHPLTDVYQSPRGVKYCRICKRLNTLLHRGAHQC